MMKRYFLNNVQKNANHPHNLYFEILSELGALGFLIFLRFSSIFFIFFLVFILKVKIFLF